MNPYPMFFRCMLALMCLQAAGAIGQTITEFPVPPHSPRSLVTGSDGNLWYTMINSAPAANNIGRMTTAGVAVEFPILTAGASSTGIALGADGNVWFTEFNAQNIGRITPAGVITEFPIPTTFGTAYYITAGPDGALWFTEGDANKIGRIATESPNTITEFPITTASSFPRGITAGPDDNLWFVEALANQVGRITPAGVITEFPIPTPAAQAQQITAGPDDNLWFCEIAASKIGRITTAGVITEFPIVGGCQFITSGLDGNLWFTGGGGGGLGNRIGRMTPAGDVTYTDIPTANSGAEGIAVGPDGAIWFAEQNASKLGRVALPPPNFLSAVSRMVHGAAGTFDLPLSLVTPPNINHNPTTEPRQGQTRTIVFTFDKPITGVTIAVSEGTATPDVPNMIGNDLIVDLTGVLDQQYVTISLTDVSSSDGATGGTGSARIGFLAGDVNGSRVVTLADVGLVNAQLAQSVTAANFTKDVNVNGTLSLADKGLANAALTRSLPLP